MTPGWPDDPETVAEAKEHPEVFAGKRIGEIADYEEAIIRTLTQKPAIIGHSFGGLLTQILAGRGLAAASVAISPAPFRGVLPLPIARAQAASPCATRELEPRGPAHLRAVPLQLRERGRRERGEGAVPALLRPRRRRAALPGGVANFNPWSEAKVDSTNPERGPMLIVSADQDHTVPWAIANASYKQKRNQWRPRSSRCRAAGTR